MKRLLHQIVFFMGEGFLSIYDYSKFIYTSNAFISSVFV